MKVYGVDFTCAPRKAKPITAAVGHHDGTGRVGDRQHRRRRARQGPERRQVGAEGEQPVERHGEHAIAAGHVARHHLQRGGIDDDASEVDRLQPERLWAGRVGALVPDRASLHRRPVAARLAGQGLADDRLPGAGLTRLGLADQRLRMQQGQTARRTRAVGGAGVRIAGPDPGIDVVSVDDRSGTACASPISMLSCTATIHASRKLAP